MDYNIEKSAGRTIERYGEQQPLKKNMGYICQAMEIQEKEPKRQMCSKEPFKMHSQPQCSAKNINMVITKLQEEETE